MPPDGPSCCPTTFNRSQGIAPGATKAGSAELATAAAQTRLVSAECCHVARAAPPSIGFGLRKCVATWVLVSSKSVACGPWNCQPKPPGASTHT